jgi:acetyl esterase/lipase
MDDFQKEQMNGVSEFVKAKENQGLDFGALFQKVMNGNEQFFENGRKGKIEDIYGYLTEEETARMANLIRHVFEHSESIKQKLYPIPKNVKVEQINTGGVAAEWQVVPGAKKNRVLLYFHGGGMFMGSPNTHRLLTVALGLLTKMRVLSVVYRLAPEHPYPAGLEDCVAAYKWLLSTGIKPENIVIAGDSAGGTLTLSTLVKLRNDGVPLPAGAVCLSPLTDFTLSGESFFGNAETDPVLADTGFFWWISGYLAGADPSDPLVSPLFADLKGLPPLLVQASTSEMLFSDSKRLVDRAKAAGVDATLETWDDMTHVFQSFGLRDLPESKEAIAKIGEFVQKLFK